MEKKPVVARVDDTSATIPSKVFDVWLKNLEIYVVDIKKHGAGNIDVSKKIIQHVVRHLDLGWAILESITRARIAKSRLSSFYGKLWHQPLDWQPTETVEDVIDRATEVEMKKKLDVTEHAAKVTWWSLPAPSRFGVFAGYVARLIGASPAIPAITLFERLADLLKKKRDGIRIAKSLSKRGPFDNVFFAEAVARLISSDLANVDVRDFDLENLRASNLSLLLRDVERTLTRTGFKTGSLRDDLPAEAAKVAKVAKTTTAKKSRKS
jgi:hypothetical protein